MTLFNIVYVSTAVLAAAVLLLIAARLRRRWGKPRAIALSAALLLITAIFWLAAPVTIGSVNRVTGVANVSALLVYALVVAFAAATLAFALYWRYPYAQAQPTVRWILAAYTATIALMVVLFTVSDVPVERRTDFDTYYADQPTVAAFLLIYLLSTLVGARYLATQLWRWAGPDAPPNVADRPNLQRALRLFAAATACPILFCSIKITAIAANWFDVHALDGLSTAAPLLNVLAVLLVLAGIAAQLRRDPATRTATA